MKISIARASGFAALALFTAGQALAQGTPITLAVDLREAPKKIIHATEMIPVQPGALTLVFPKWIPGEHGPTGPIDDQAGFVISGNGATIKWQRDQVDMYAYHLTVPAGVSQIEVKNDFLAAPNGGSFTAGGSTSANLAMLSWNTIVVYPYSGPEMKVSDVMVTPSVTLPDGWKFASALEAENGSGSGAGTGPGEVKFKSVSLEELIDSPVLAGRYFREVALAPDVTPKHFLDMAADSPADLEISQAHIDEFSNLVRQTGFLYRSRHYGAYHFLVTLSDQVLHFGLEHHQSSDDRVAPNTFTSDSAFTLEGLLLPHEFTHSWNGKYRRPAGLATPNYQVPMIGDGLWVYEGLTEYLGDVLAARSGIWTAEQYRDRLAGVAAALNARPGRTWRDLQDTARMAQVLYSVGGPFDNYRRDTDFYNEGELLWLDVDVTMRNKSKGKKSLDDFIAAFHGLGGNTAAKVVPYTFEDVVAGLNSVVPNDWAAFLRTRLDSNLAGAPLGGINGGGFKLTFKDQPNAWDKLAASERKGADMLQSIGLQVGGDGTIADVLHGGVSDKAGLGPGMKLIAVNGTAFSPGLLQSSVKEAKSGSTPIDLIVENTGSFKVVKLDYHGGEMYPALERVQGDPDRIDEIIKPRTK